MDAEAEEARPEPDAMEGEREDEAEKTVQPEEQTEAPSEEITTSVELDNNAQNSNDIGDVAEKEKEMENDGIVEEAEGDTNSSDESDQGDVQLAEEEVAEQAASEAVDNDEAVDAAEAAKDTIAPEATAEPAPAAEAAKASETSKVPTPSPASPAPSSSSSSNSDDEEAADDIGELRPEDAKGSDDDDTKSDVSETGMDEEEENAGDKSPRSKQRLTSFDKRQEKFSMMKANVKTFDVNLEVVIGKWKRLREDFIKLRANSVLSSGDDGSLMITRRMTEIGNMCSSTTNAEYYIATLPEKVQAAVKKMTRMSREEFTETRRKGWSPYDWFLYAARMARVLAQGCLVRRRLTIEALANGRSMSEKDLFTNSMSKTLRDCMSYCPEYRTKEMRQKILWFLRTNKVYTHLFSSEMEEECSKFVFYEKYQDGRILSLCNRVPEKFYFVISGKIERRKTYELRSGDYDRVFSVISKGQTSDVGQIELQKPKKFTLVASGLTEVLTLERSDFIQLLKGTGGPPLKFIQGIGIFKEFPCDKFLTTPEAIVTRYYPKDRVILEDIANTQWIHIIKSGTAKVIRKQMVFHYARNKYSRDRAIGYAKTPSHSLAMQGLMERQRRYKAANAPTADSLLPTLAHANRPPGVNPLSHTIGIVQQHQRTDSDQLMLPKVTTSPTVASEDAGGASVDAKSRRSRPLNMTARELQIPLRSAGKIRAAARPLSRQRTTAAAQTLLGPEGFPAERSQREAYVVLDTLKSGDFLGFRNITAMIEGDRIIRNKENVHTLLSEGAEIILISKRFFIQNAANNTMLKSETMSREFASQDEASLSIDTKEDWDMFRAAFIQRMVGHNKMAKKERQFGVL